MKNPQNRFGLPFGLACKENSLKFSGDRLNFDDWWSILNGISQDQTLLKICIYSRWYRKKVREHINSEKELAEFWQKKGKRLQPVLYTNYLLRCISDAVGHCLQKSSTLAILILDGIPLSINYLKILCTGLSENINLKTLSLARCQITDLGCTLVLRSLENNINLQRLNFTSCKLTHNSGFALSVFLKKRRQLLLGNKWTESTKSIKNTELQVRGLHTLILNKNPSFSDAGLCFLSEALERDFWIRVLNLNLCGLREKGGEAIVELLRTNSTITKMDFNRNNISKKISDVVKKLLRRRKKSGERISMKKRLIAAKNLNSNDTKSKKIKGLIKTSSRNKRDRKNTKLRKKGEKSTTRISRINRQKKKTLPGSSNQNRKANFVEFKLRLSNIVDYNKRLSDNLEIKRELLEKERKIRLEIENFSEKIEPEIAKLCRGILVHVEKETKNYSRNSV